MTKKTLARLPIFFVFVLIATLAYVSLQQFLGPDDYMWHVVMGQDFIEKGSGGLVDTHSFTMPGKRYAYVSWIYQILSYAFYAQFGGMLGLQIFRMILWLLPLFVIFFFFHQRNTHWAIQIIAYLYLGYACVCEHWLRPELIAYTANLLFMMFVLKYRTVWSPKALVAAIAGLTIWGNFHTSNVFGFLILGALYFEWLIHFYRNRKATTPPWLQFTVLAISTFMVGFLNPTFQHSVILISHALGEWKPYIAEYQSFLVGGDTLPAALVFVPILIWTIYFCFKRQAWSICLIFVFMFIESLTMLKMRYHLIIMVLPVLDFVFKDMEATVARARGRRGFQLGLAVLFSGLVFAPAHAIWLRMNLLPIGSELPNAEFATDVLQHMSHHGLTGKVIAPYNLSSAVMLQLKNSSVYIDGRSGILYPVELMKRSLEIQSWRDFKKEIETYEIDYALFDKSFFRSVDFRSFRSVFRPIYVGESHFLFKTQNLGEILPLQQIYFSPECVELLNVQNLEAQERSAYLKGLIVPNSTFGNLQSVLNLYFHSFKETLSPAFFATANELLSYEDGLRRLGVYWAKKAGNFSLASIYNSQIQIPTTYDRIQLVGIYLERNLIREAAIQLADVIEIGVPVYYSNQVGGLIAKLRQKTGSIIVSDEIYEKFKNATLAKNDAKTNLCGY